MKTLRRKFLPKQQEAFQSMAPEVLFSGAFGAGKTRLLAEKALFLGMKYPGIDIGIFRKTRTSLTFTTLKTFLSVVPRQFIDKYNKSEAHITLVNGSEYIFGGLEEPSRWGSLELGAVFCDEVIEFAEDDYNMLLGRLRQVRITDSKGIDRELPFRQAFSATNPGNPSHWLYQRAYVDKLMQVVESRTEDNIYNPKSYLELMKRFKGRYRERFVEGKWISFEGAIYDNFFPPVHIIKPFEIPDDWRKIRAIDFGYPVPFVCLWLALSPDDKIYVYRELYGTKRIVEDWAKDIERLSSKEDYEATVADWDAEDRATLERYGINTQEAIKDVIPGIQEVYARISYTSDKPARLYLFEESRANEADVIMIDKKHPTCTEEEFPGYSWEKNKEGRPVKEKPIKVNDHGLDALRYGVMYFAATSQATGEIVQAEVPTISMSEY